MKKSYLIISVLLGLTFFQSCEEPSDYTLNEFIIEYAEIIPSNNFFYFITDSGLKLYPSSTYIPWYYPKDTTRVIVNYTLLDQSENLTYDYYIFLNDVFEILTKPIVFLTEENNDSLGNDLISLNAAWIHGKYLNMDFNYSGGYEVHMLNLVAKEDSINNNPLTLEFRHNAYNDPAEAWLNGIVAFNLNQVIPQDADSINLLVKFKEETDGFEEKSELERFTESLNRQLLNELSRDLFQQEFGNEGLTSGTYTFGSLVVEISPTTGGLSIDIFDTETGEQTQIIIPN